MQINAYKVRQLSHVGCHIKLRIRSDPRIPLAYPNTSHLNSNIDVLSPPLSFAVYIGNKALLRVRRH